MFIDLINKLSEGDIDSGEVLPLLHTYVCRIGQLHGIPTHRPAHSNLLAPAEISSTFDIFKHFWPNPTSDERLGARVNCSNINLARQIDPRSPEASEYSQMSIWTVYDLQI